MPFPATVISLVRRTDRREQFLQWNRCQTGLAFSFFDAIDGTTLDRASLETEGLITPDAIYTSGSLGNALSHRALWVIAESQTQPTLIFEDDACLQHDFPPLETCLERLPEGWDFFMLGYNTDAVVTLALPSGLPVSAVFGDRIKAQPGYFERFSQDKVMSSRPGIFPVHQAWGILAYVVSPRGARRLLDACFPLISTDLRLDVQNRSIRTYGIDGMMNVGLRNNVLRGFALFPPVVLGPNTPEDSDVVPRGRHREGTRQT